MRAARTKLAASLPAATSSRLNSSGFAPFQSQAIAINPGQAKRVDIAMAIQVEQQNVVVTDESPTVNVEASGNANAIVLKGKDLDALSDDPDELSSELSALAGPSAGPNGGQIFIDGFSGGQLPPKSAIREIRINQNPFSAEYDRLGYGRIEILTKPGTDKLHGQFFFQGNNSIFNTGNPFTPEIPSYYSYQYNASVSGAINKKASFFVSDEAPQLQQRECVADSRSRSSRTAPVCTMPRPTTVSHFPIQRIRNNASGASRLAVGRPQHTHRSLRLLERVRARQPERGIAAQRVHPRVEHRIHRAGERRLRHQRSRRERDPLPVRAAKRESLS